VRRRKQRSIAAHSDDQMSTRSIEFRMRATQYDDPRSRMIENFHNSSQSVRVRGMSIGPPRNDRVVSVEQFEGARIVPVLDVLLVLRPFCRDENEWARHRL
jgi:hypothetical protein